MGGELHPAPKYLAISCCRGTRFTRLGNGPRGWGGSSGDAGVSVFDARSGVPSPRTFCFCSSFFLRRGKQKRESVNTQITIEIEGRELREGWTQYATGR